MIESQPRPCADPEELAAFVEGTLPPERRTGVIQHLSRCARCRSVIESIAQVREEQRSYWRRVALAVAAAVIAVLSGLLAVQSFGTWRRGPWRRGPLVRLAAAMPSSARTVEPRLAGFRWAPFHTLRKGADGRKSPEELTVEGAAGAVLRDIGEKRSPDALHTAGVAYVLGNDAASAIARLRETAIRTPRDAAVWSDLSAALYCGALARDDQGGYREALAAAGRAIQLAPRMPEPYFNRALILERTGPASEAISAWNAFLAVDGETDWASEAREHLRDAGVRQRP